MATINSVNTSLSGQTGTGGFVGSTSPTLVTPVLVAASATSLSFSPSTGGIIGTITNNNATSGDVGEYIDSSLHGPINFGATGVSATITSISLTGGDWDVWSQFTFFPQEGSVYAGAMIGGMSVSSSSVSQGGVGIGEYYQLVWAPNVSYAFSPSARVSVSSTTTVYLIALATYTGTAPQGYGQLVARRRR